jgi:NAD(P)-dependent dehydrogenase (short-subunit alcohol dehydrogenase family)
VGIEGFLEATRQEIAPFNIQTTIVVPGGGHTSIFDAGRLVHGLVLSAYAGTPARRTGEFLEGGT